MLCGPPHGTHGEDDRLRASQHDNIPASQLASNGNRHQRNAVRYLFCLKPLVRWMSATPHDAFSSILNRIGSYNQTNFEFRIPLCGAGGSFSRASHGVTQLILKVDSIAKVHELAGAAPKFAAHNRSSYIASMSEK